MYVCLRLSCFCYVLSFSLLCNYVFVMYALRHYWVVKIGKNKKKLNAHCKQFLMNPSLSSLSAVGDARWVRCSGLVDRTHRCHPAAGAHPAHPLPHQAQQGGEIRRYDKQRSHRPRPYEEIYIYTSFI